MRNFSERTVVVDKETLLTHLRTNLAQHINDYKEAHSMYVDRWISTVGIMLEAAKKSGETRNTLNNLVEPQSYEKDYKQIIEMLEMSVDATVEISATEFQAFVKDNWTWKHGWASVANSYTSKSYG